MPLTAGTEDAGSGPPPRLSGATLELHPSPRPSRRGQVAVGARPARLISRGRWKGAEGGGERGRRPMGWAGDRHVAAPGRGPGVLTRRRAGASASARSPGGGAGVRARGGCSARIGLWPGGGACASRGCWLRLASVQGRLPACGRGSGREDRAGRRVREPGGGAGAVAAAAAEEEVAAGAGTGPGGMSEAEAAVVATAAPGATVPATAAGVVAVVVPVPAGEPQKAGGGAGGGGVGAASGPAAGTPSAPGPRTPGNPATAASGTSAPPARSQADKPVLGEGRGTRQGGSKGVGGWGRGIMEPGGVRKAESRSCSEAQRTN